MTKGANRDIVVGGLMLVLAVVLFALIYGYGIQRHAKPAGYKIEAAFHRLEGITVGSQVRMSGVVIGHVGMVRLEKDFRVITTLVLDNNLGIPRDSAALIRTDGLLGSKHVDLQPGGDDVLLKSNERVIYTQDSISIEDLLGLVIREGKSKQSKIIDNAKVYENCLLDKQNQNSSFEGEINSPFSPSW